MDDEWMTDAHCRGVHGVFFADDARAAKAICEQCPVREQCREYALALPPREAVGVWGGLTDRERRRVRVELRRSVVSS